MVWHLLTIATAVYPCSMADRTILGPLPIRGSWLAPACLPVTATTMPCPTCAILLPVPSQARGHDLRARYASAPPSLTIDKPDRARKTNWIMWIAGDMIFLTAILLVVAGWMRAEARDEARSDRRADAELAQIRIRERRLAERLADERVEPGA